MLEVVKKLGEIACSKYIKSREEWDDDIDTELAFENEDENSNEDSDAIIDDNRVNIFLDILILEEEIFFVYIGAVENGGYTINQIKILIDELEKRCIFNEKAIVEWINKYSEEYPKHFDYMLAVENLREAFVYYLKNIELPNLISKNYTEKFGYGLKLNSNNCNKYIESISNLDISKIKVTNYYQYSHGEEPISIISGKVPDGAIFACSGSHIVDDHVYITRCITLTCENITDNFILEEYIVKACLAIKADKTSGNKTFEDKISVLKDIRYLCNNDIFPANVEELKKEFYILFRGRENIKEISNINFSKVKEFAYIGEPIYYDEIGYSVTFFFITNNKFYFVNYI